MAIKVNHHSFTVTSVEKTVAFYREAFGLEVIRISERKDIPSYDTLLGYPKVHIIIALLKHPTEPFVLELVQYLNPPAQPRKGESRDIGSSHIAYEVPDIDAMHQKVCAAGGSSISPPTDVVRDGRRVARAMYALDPDGIPIEVFQAFDDVIKR
jgi:catechol 2,3-dioxygenase-like lactoylglutathione lyase family enzyme